MLSRLLIFVISILHLLDKRTWLHFLDKRAWLHFLYKRAWLRNILLVLNRQLFILLLFFNFWFLNFRKLISNLLNGLVNASHSIIDGVSILIRLRLFLILNWWLRLSLCLTLLLSRRHWLWLTWILLCWLCHLRKELIKSFCCVILSSWLNWRIRWLIYL